jgi:hypothetical protein
MKNKLKIFVYVGSFIPLLMTTQSYATIYKCVNSQAEVYYNDKPCPITNIERKIKAVKDPEGGYIPPAFKEDVSKARRNNGVVVGEENQRKLLSNNKQNEDGDQASTQTFGGNESGANSTAAGNNNADNGNANYQTIASNAGGSSTGRTQKKPTRQTPLPTIPLRVEKNAREPRGKVYE